MTNPEPAPAIAKQELYWASSQDRWVCARCNDMNHRHCLRSGCECCCLDPHPLPRRKVPRVRNGLSAEEKQQQCNFPFDDFESLKV